MRIQHNIAALNSYRQLSGNNSAVSKNLEKLSSGYKINRAGDDAAGLAISEKMRAQITGLETAQKNANDGISLVQTAEGALTEVHSMLNRMVELATQSANGTYDNDVDRANLQKELDSLLEEVDRISDATNFNGINLLDGSLGGAKVTTTPGVKAGTTKGTAPTVANADALTTGTATHAANTTFEVDLTNVTITQPADKSEGGTLEITIGDGKVTLDATATKGLTNGKSLVDALAGKEIEIKGVKYTMSDGTNNKVKFTAADTNDHSADVSNLNVKVSTTAGTLPEAAGKAELNFSGRTGKDLLGSTVTIGDSKYAFVEAGTTPPTGFTAVEITKDTTSDDLANALLAKANADAKFDVAATQGNTASVTFTAKDTATKEVKVTTAGAGLTLQVGDTDDDFQKVRVAVGDMSTKGLGLDELKQTGIADQITAGKSIKNIKTAINTVSSTRGDLGAIQNRLEHTINNLGVTTENMTAAESRIRDTDMAKEMMAYTKNNILVQAAQAMLAQANQVPQGVLQLLQ